MKMRRRQCQQPQSPECSVRKPPFVSLTTMLALANRRFAGTADAESAYNLAFDEISADDWRCLLNGYSGTGSAPGVFRITCVRLLEEYAVRKYDRRRPPVWVRCPGTLWVRVFERLCLQRQLPKRAAVIQRQSSKNSLAGLLTVKAGVGVERHVAHCDSCYALWTGLLNNVFTMPAGIGQIELPCCEKTDPPTC